METEWLNFQSFSLVIKGSNNKKCNSHLIQKTLSNHQPQAVLTDSHKSPVTEFYGSLHGLVLKAEAPSRQNGSYYSLKSLNLGPHLFDIIVWGF